MRRVLFNEPAAAKAAIQQRVQQALEHEYAGSRQDLMQVPAEACLNLLRAKTKEQIQLDNLALRRENLEQAREHIGTANAIVLLDRIQYAIDADAYKARAVVFSAQSRPRPILLTTCTTVTGMIPLYRGGGPMFEPMAVVIIFGLAFARVLTLVIVPLLYVKFFRVSFKGYEYKPQSAKA